MGAAGWVAAGAHAASAEAAAAPYSARRARFIAMHRERGVEFRADETRVESQMVSPASAGRQVPAARRVHPAALDGKQRTSPRENAMTGRSSFLLLALAAACTPPAPAPTPAPVPAETPARPTMQPRPPNPVPVPENRPQLAAPPTLTPASSMGAVHWWRNSAEQRAVFLQTYRWAGERLRALAAREPRGTWAVIMDADETTLDNSPYQLRRGSQNLGYTSESWAAWTREKAAAATPGAAEFTRLVHELGGRVAIVTNRDEELCPDTRENLRQVGIAFEVVLCRVQGQSDKNPRFAAVQSGTGTGQPPLKVLMWVGDNIQDFPRLTQDARSQPSSLDEFGRAYVILPNPMYGSWERNPVQ
jgi:5'-nucleotidase (lipoprotein e(P4) family)